VKKKIVGYGVLGFVLLILLGFGMQALGIISIGIQREVVQHSQPYVETKISLLHSLYNDWLQLDSEVAESGNETVIRAKTAQQKAILMQMREESELIPSSEVPQSIKVFLATH